MSADNLVRRRGSVFQLRVGAAVLDDCARRITAQASRRPERLIAHHVNDVRGGYAEYSQRLLRQARDSGLSDAEDTIFVELIDDRDVSTELHVVGEVRQDRSRVLRVAGPSVVDSLAALLLEIRDLTDLAPHLYLEEIDVFRRTGRLTRFLGDCLGTAAVTREVLRRAEPDAARRPRVHTF